MGAAGKDGSFKRLFEPIRLGQRKVKNRIVSTAHVTNYDEGGVLTDRHVAYYERKTRGGLGLIIAFGSANVHRGAAVAFNAINLWDPRNDDHLRELAQKVHAHGCLIMSQATHMGRRASSFESGEIIQAPSAVPELVHAEVPKALSIPEIPAIVQSFAEAANRLESCGWDGIEITSFGGHLIEQFWSPVVNQRTDRYGGDFERRMRFSIEVVEAVAKAVSDDFIVGFRLSGEPGSDEVGLNADDMLVIAERLDKIGRINLFDVSGSTGATREAQAGTVPPDYYPRGCYNQLSRRMKERLSVPVLVAGRILDPAQAEAALAAGECDLVGMTRALIADPDLPKLAQEGKGELIRPCNAMNQDCIGRVTAGLPLQCSVNPEIGRELELTRSSRTTAPRPRIVVIVGGGPAGMEAARVAAERGHKVVLLERCDHLGGQLAAAARAPGRPHLRLHTVWLERELQRLKVEVRIHAEATMDAVVAEKPDAVIVATGAKSIVPEGARTTRARCETDIPLLEGKIPIEKGARVLVYDREGQIRGASVAAFAAAAGAAVELALPLLEVGEKVDPWHKPFILRQLFEEKVVCSTNEMLVAKGNNPPMLRHAWSGRERLLDEFDLVIFAGFRQARDELGAALMERASATDVRLVGDCVAPRRLYDAVLEGVRAGGAV